jgi:hypothetical protein
MKYNGAFWDDVGSPGFSSGNVSWNSIKLSKNGTPYVSFVDGADSGKVSEMKFNGSNWVYVGDTGISFSGQYPALAIDSTGTPYVSYIDIDNKVVVKKFNGGSWNTLGSLGISASGAWNTNLAIGPGNSPFVAFNDSLHGGNPTVMKFNGAEWDTVGSPGFCSGSVSYQSLSLLPDGTPLLLIFDSVFLGGLTVQHFNGSSWGPLGGTGMSGYYAYDRSMAVDASGTPYVVFAPIGLGVSGGRVMKFDGTSWESVGSPGFSSGGIGYCSIAIDNNGIPYVGFRDDFGEQASVVTLDSGLNAILGWDTICVGVPATFVDTKAGGVWSTSNVGIAVIDSDGNVTGMAKGTFIVSYTKGGNSVTFAAYVDSLPIPPSAIRDSICMGSHLFLAPYGGSGMWAWVSFDTSIAEITGAGLLTGIYPGIDTLQLTVINVCGASIATYPVKVAPCTNLVAKYSPSQAAINIFPNPCDNVLCVSANDVIETITIYDAIGRSLIEHRFHSETITLDLSALPAGIYFCRVNRMLTRGFTKQ